MTNIKSFSLLTSIPGLGVSAACGLVLLGGFHSMAAAQELAVPNRVPASPQAVLSIPRTAELWENFSSAPLGQATIELFNQPALRESPDFERLELQLNTIREQSGISLWPGALFSEHLAGVDIYAVQWEGEPELYVAFRCAEPGLPQKVFEQVRRDAGGASGVAHGVSAGSVEEIQVHGHSVLHLPAFQMYLATDGGELLYWATHREVLQSGLENVGARWFESASFRRSWEALGEGQADVWMSGNFAHLEPVLAAPLSAIPNAPFARAGSRASAFRIGVAADHIKMTTFTRYTAMEELERRYGLAAPEPGDLPALDFFSESALAIFATNYFDGLTLMDQSLAAMGQAAQAPIRPEMIEQQMAASRDVFGFDFRNDLLANLGPQLGVTLNEFQLSPTGSEVPKIDFLLVAGVKDRDRFQMVLNRLEEFLAAEDANDSPLTTVTHNGVDIHVFEEQYLAAMGFRPSYYLTRDNYFLLSLQPEAIADAMSRFRGESPAITASELYSGMSGNLSEAKTSLFLAPAGPLAAAATESAEPLTAGLTPEQRLNVEALLKLLRSFRAIGGATIYEADGKRDEFVISM